ncbi:hypothetical protein [Mucilaginibacter pedocola]|uniref:Uncharacterized protein n=1 Tax=Mucilaginibacter pedocola TaxID=1792845 RepID=A0A1S9PDQ4_9SPHI|nr:hypothetical protein [Mucilaginibacter pedocola]OOQ59082.1 hypothetical protein BC343_29645 [Mucilaginibacter pedocola]
MPFANILTLYNPSNDSLDICKQLLSQNSMQFILLESTFFIKTHDKAQTSALINALKATGYIYTFLFIFNIDGSALRANGVDAGTTNNIAGILNLLT